MHLICPHPSPHQILHNLCFSLLLDISAVPREVENNAYAKFWGANKVHYGRWAYVNELKDKGTAIPHSRNYKGMGTSLWGNDFGIVWVDKR